MSSRRIRLDAIVIDAQLVPDFIQLVRVFDPTAHRSGSFGSLLLLIQS